jgi:endonuclease/exonuclease/phosphatase family metal-dependent hydrolase
VRPVTLGRVRLRRWIAVAVAVPWVAWAVGRTLGLDVAHPLVAVVAFTPYAAVTSVVPVLLALLLRQWAVAVVAGAAAALLGVAVAPRAVADEELVTGREVTVMTANVYVGRGDVRRLMDLARRHGVDVLCLQEVRASTLSRLDAAAARKRLPERMVQRSTGNAIVSRWPLRAREDGPNALTAVVDVPGGGALRITSLHPLPPLTRARERQWRGDLRRLPPAGASGGPGGDVTFGVLAGDFNATLDHRALRGVLDRGYVDAGQAMGDGLRPTWPVGRRTFPITIDHVLADRRMGIRAYSVHTVPGSDHRAVISRLALPRH